jgi:hypothetical protein
MDIVVGKALGTDSVDHNQRKEQFSKAYIQAVASVAGFSATTPTVDDDRLTFLSPEVGAMELLRPLGWNYKRRAGTRASLSVSILATTSSSRTITI